MSSKRPTRPSSPSVSRYSECASCTDVDSVPCCAHHSAYDPAPPPATGWWWNSVDGRLPELPASSTRGAEQMGFHEIVLGRTASEIGGRLKSIEQADRMRRDGSEDDRDRTIPVTIQPTLGLGVRPSQVTDSAAT